MSEKPPTARQLKQKRRHTKKQLLSTLTSSTTSLCSSIAIHFVSLHRANYRASHIIQQDIGKSDVTSIELLEFVNQYINPVDFHQQTTISPDYETICAQISSFSTSGNNIVHLFILNTLNNTTLFLKFEQSEIYIINFEVFHHFIARNPKLAKDYIAVTRPGTMVRDEGSHVTQELFQPQLESVDFQQSSSQSTLSSDTIFKFFRTFVEKCTFT
ncbi:hypothetical protein RCL1_007696 [Eukaryota sp. TZLM3-RCL]